MAENEQPSPTQAENDLRRLKMEGKEPSDLHPPTEVEPPSPPAAREERAVEAEKPEKPEATYKTRHLRHDRS